jgi:hypothetical protein
MLIRKLFTLMLTLLVCSGSFAQYDYPELNVVPAASEVLMEEAKHEKRKKYSDYSPFLIPAVMTLSAGLLAIDNVTLEPDTSPNYEEENKKAKMAPNIAIGIGAVWIGAIYMMRNNYKPYLKGYRKIHKKPTKSKRDKLARERVAEREIYRSASLMNKLKYISFITNFYASNNLSNYADGEAASIASSFSLIASFIPLFFTPRWVENRDIHKENKKKIYAPIQVESILYDKQSRKFIPGVKLTYQF